MLEQIVNSDGTGKQNCEINAAKPTDHKYMMEWLRAYRQFHRHKFLDEKKEKHCYKWMNDVPLHGGERRHSYNYLSCTISVENEEGK